MTVSARDNSAPSYRRLRTVVVAAIHRQDRDLAHVHAVQHLERYLVAGAALLPDAIVELGLRLHGIRADAQDYVAHGNARALGRSPRRDARDEEVTLQSVCGDAEPRLYRTCALTLGHEVGKDGLEQVDRHEQIAGQLGVAV